MTGVWNELVAPESLREQWEYQNVDASLLQGGIYSWNF